MAPSGSRKRRRTDENAAEAGELSSGPAPIIDASPGLKPDVRIRVLDKSYHVHFIILKLHSNYFRRFLDSPERQGTRASADFQYEYVAVFDGDGTMGLEPGAVCEYLRFHAHVPCAQCHHINWVARLAIGNIDCFPSLQYQRTRRLLLEGYQRHKTLISKSQAENTAQNADIEGLIVATRIFPMLLSAMYSRPYQLSSFEDFFSLVRLVDFYCALP